MIIRLYDGTLIEININDFLTDESYYENIMKIKQKIPEFFIIFSKCSIL